MSNYKLSDEWNAARGGRSKRLLEFGVIVHDNHNVRNAMQRGNTAATVYDQYCSDGILDTLQVIEHCFPVASQDFNVGMTTAIRIIQLYSSQGLIKRRSYFETEMRIATWNLPLQRATVHKRPFAAGERSNWGLIIASDADLITNILTQIGVP